jgi:ribonuclease HII
MRPAVETLSDERPHGRVPQEVRVVADDYGIGGPFSDLLEDLRIHGADLHRERGADDRYIESRVASVRARRERDRIVREMMRAQMQPPRDERVGLGWAHAKETQTWLKPCSQGI